jgi:hypothetical protein
MNHLKPFNESEDWKKYEREGKLRKSLRNKLSLLGKRVRRMGEYGTIVIGSFDDEDPEYFIMFKENDDMEQLLGLPFEIWDDNKGKFVEDSNDINPFFELTDEEKDFLNLKDGFVSSI